MTVTCFLLALFSSINLEVSGAGDIPASRRPLAWETSPQAGGLRRGIHPRKLEVSGVGYIPASWRSPAWDTSPQAGGLRRGRHPRKQAASGVGKIFVRLFVSSHPWSLWRGVGSTLTSGATILETIPLVNDPR